MVAKSIAKIYTNIHKPTDYWGHKHSQAQQLAVWPRTVAHSRLRDWAIIGGV